jgi:hypothetical protein
MEQSAMNNSASSRSLLDSASRWVRNTWSKYADGAALQASGEAEQVARDLNLSMSELQTLCAGRGASPELLQRRLSQLDLDRNEIKRAYPGVLRDLEKTCALCTSDAKCGREFKRSADPKAWTDYCPNAPTLQDLQQAHSHDPAA